QFSSDPPFRLQLGCRRAALCLERATNFIEAHQREGVPVDVLEARKHAAPDRRRLFGGVPRTDLISPGGGQSFIDHPPPPRSIPETDSPAPPFTVLTRKVSSHEHDLSGTADEPKLRGIPLGLNQVAVGHPS